MISYESQGSMSYKVASSEAHVLEKMPNCTYCGAVKFEYESPTFCCDNGKVKLVHVEVPDKLYELFTSKSKEAMAFRKNIRLFNCIFSFTSIGVKLAKELASSRQGVYTFRAQGMVYHDLPGLLPDEKGPNPFQLYFIETENEVENRMRILENSSICEATVQKLLRVLEADQVAAIWVEGNDGDIPFERDIIVYSHSGHRHRIKHYYGCNDPRQYPILFPRGDTG
ncbi:hypothetical protein Sango_3026800 [Sesamum angolense]|uniref:Uncharacterized protein n=1 Tax=Sesamum angolense TaxID=2727404 RepID=A0AAE1T3E0_9LAMI|nr:hypothetical protein Sango_3026800 [Sesamum angolense]